MATTEPEIERARKPGIVYPRPRNGRETANCYDCGLCCWVRTMCGQVQTPVSNPRFTYHCQPCIHATLGLVEREEEPGLVAALEVEGTSFRFRRRAEETP